MPLKTTTKINNRARLNVIRWMHIECFFLAKFRIEFRERVGFVIMSALIMYPSECNSKADFI